MNDKSKRRLIIVDISSFIFRAFFAIRRMNAPDGTPTNAVAGVWNMLYKLVSKYQPTHVFLARDSKEKTFRHEMYPEYKANRDTPPEDLIPQFALIVELTEKMGLHGYHAPGYEADDLIGSAAVQWKDHFDEILIASGDKDLMQFVGDNVKMLDTMKDKIYSPEDVVEKMGVRPDQIVDYLSIIGDSSDNIPGMYGIGAKGAAKLLGEYGSLDGIIEHKDELKGKRVIEAFTDHLDKGLLSRELVKIVTDIDMPFEEKDAEYKFAPTNELRDFFDRLGMKAALKRIEDMEFHEVQSKGNGEGVSVIVDRSGHHFKSIVVQEKNLDELVKAVQSNEILTLNTEYDSKDLITRKLTSLSITVDGKESYFCPVRHHEDQTSEKAQNLSEKDVTDIIKLILEDQQKTVYTEHAKRDYIYFQKAGINMVAKIFDIIQVHYIVDADANHDFSYIADRYLHTKPEKLDKNDPPLHEMPIERCADLCAEKTCLIHLLGGELTKELREKELESVYFDIDYKLIPILAHMEYEGIQVNREYLQELEVEFTKELHKIEAQIGKYTEDPINLNSPKQVGSLLFEHLGMPVIKKTKTGPSTDSSVLEELASQNINEVPELILKYREVGKLLSTYVKALPESINPKTGRVHTTFSQHTAATGRLASVNPNIQNIPVRTENGRRIRKAFVAKPGKLFLSADYSQVELRILAHFSEDPTMLKAFKQGVDIHAQTAAEVSGVPVEKVTSAERSKAKAVNFGLMYGQSSFGLAAALRIPRNEARDYITKYFERFGKIKGYLDSLKDEAEKNGYSITMFGRKRYLPDIKSSNRNIKAAAERVAVNSPIQGTAADIIKLAMIEVNRRLTAEGLSSKMLLQVHDELIFEVEESELAAMKKLVKESMENVVKMKVPLLVEIGIGVNWFDLK